MWLSWGIRWLWVQVLVRFIGEGSGHIVHVNNQPMIILLVPLCKGEMFLGVWLTYTENGSKSHFFFLHASPVLHLVANSPQHLFLQFVS